MKKIFVVLAVAFTMGSINAYAAPATTTDAPAVLAPAADANDELLNEYERYVNKVIAVYKKAQAGDMTAMTEYAGLAEQAAKLAEKVEKAYDNMSEAQIARYVKITQKLASVAM